MNFADPPDSLSGSVTRFFHELRAGTPGAAEQLWARYFPRLVALARRTLAGKPQRHADADDAALSAFASFCLRAQGGEFTVTGRDNLWHLLSVITVRKALKQARREGAAGRGAGRVRGEGDLLRPDGSPLPLAEVVTAPPSDEFDLHARELLDQLDPDLRAIAVLRLMGYRDQEIADRLDCAVRTVGRKLALIRLEWATAWPESEGK
jgi:DNA-directed RNA polymerase specialized sigma24 family protein